MTYDSAPLFSKENYERRIFYVGAIQWQRLDFQYYLSRLECVRKLAVVRHLHWTYVLHLSDRIRFQNSLRDGG